MKAPWLTVTGKGAQGACGTCGALWQPKGSALREFPS